MWQPPPPGPLEPVDLPVCRTAGVRLFCKRDDRYRHPGHRALQGNKVRKLAHLLRSFSPLPPRPRPRVLTYGGAYSNHLAAIAEAGKHYGFSVHCRVRGEPVRNPVLDFVRACGATLEWTDREAYRRQTRGRNQLQREGDHLVIPEGGTVPEALEDTGDLYSEITTQLGGAPDVVALAMGTGGTAAGVIRRAAGRSRIEVFPALRGNWTAGVLREMAGPHPFTVVADYHFGGYGKFPAHWAGSRGKGIVTPARVASGLPPLEPVYTAKLFYGLLDRIGRGLYPRGTRLVAIHTGGIF